MKKLISLLLAAVMVLSLCACGSSKPKKKSLDELTAEDFQAAAEQLMGEEATQAPAEAEQKVYKLGETITMMDDMIELTVYDFCFSESVNRGDVTIPTSETHYSSIEKAAEGKTFIICSATINYLGNLKRDFNLMMETGEGTIDYNDGYIFKEANIHAMIGDTKTSGNVATFEPLSDKKTGEYRVCFEVPKVVESDTQSPLLLKLRLSGYTLDPNGPYATSIDKTTNYYKNLDFTIQLR